ncbi:hypothetical protein KQX54_007382 [Cotesia glomerata]|uniref:Uncharacterized protein n=2 Tax=Cotesia glomerata TaxID=32391 RepID=A0AAV7I5X9_COTGL|nr:hypothetical protein KQX54_007382 [Cotesia glomerata]
MKHRQFVAVNNGKKWLVVPYAWIHGQRCYFSDEDAPVQAYKNDPEHTRRPTRSLKWVDVVPFLTFDEAVQMVITKNEERTQVEVLEEVREDEKMIRDGVEALQFNAERDRRPTLPIKNSDQLEKWDTYLSQGPEQVSYYHSLIRDYAVGIQGPRVLVTTFEKTFAKEFRMELCLPKSGSSRKYQSIRGNLAYTQFQQYFKQHHGLEENKIDKEIGANLFNIKRK